MIRVRQVKIPITNDQKDVIQKKIANKLHIPISQIQSYQVRHKSIDARDKKNIFYVYEFDVCVQEEERVLKRKMEDVFVSSLEKYQFVIEGTEKIQKRIVIVGSGPCGLFCAYLLAKAGYKPLILERGEKIEDRVHSVDQFFQTGILKEESNVAFGEGGAGTFSDGKLNSSVKDKANRGKCVFDIFVENGAPQAILTLSNPHIGTDVLREVVLNMRKKILSMGGDIRFCSKVTDFIIEKGKIQGVIVNDTEKIDCDLVVLAIGHSARDTFKTLYHKGVSMKGKNFAVGVRVEHPQEMINRSQYGDSASLLPPASYKLTYQTKNKRGVYSFCMCPGGYVVNASSEKGCLVVNGMSYHKRDSNYANSAIVVTVSKDDFKDDLFGGMKFQQELEKKAFAIGNGKIPVQLYKDFQKNQISSSLGEVLPMTKGDWKFANIREIFPSFITDSLLEAMPYFGQKIHGFDREDVLFLGVESRTSSPIMIERNEEGVSNILGLYPGGEGAGYAGGITTAAIDGIKIAEKIAQKYKPFS